MVLALALADGVDPPLSGQPVNRASEPRRMEARTIVDPTAAAAVFREELFMTQRSQNPRREGRKKRSVQPDGMTSDCFRDVMGTERTGTLTACVRLSRSLRSSG